VQSQLQSQEMPQPQQRRVTMAPPQPQQPVVQPQQQLPPIRIASITQNSS
jgi:hypothetical protein